MTLRVAGRMVDITPQLYLPATGYSLTGKGNCIAVWNRLYATVFVVEGADGSRCALVGADIHSGTRPVVERMARNLDLDAGIDEEGIFLAASHTHHAPGNFYGYSYYDSFAGRGVGFNEAWVDWLALRLRTAVVTLANRLEPARVGYGTAAAAGLSRNRSPRAFCRNRDRQGRRVVVSAFARDVGHPGDCEELDTADLVLDPRVHLMWFEGRDGEPVGGFASIGAHNTFSGSKHRTMTSDSFGVARRVVRDAMFARWGRRVPLAVVGGSTGDVNLYLKGQQDPGPGRACVKMGRRLGRLIWEACDEARGAVVESDELTLRYREARAPEGQLSPAPTCERQLASEWWVGQGISMGGQGVTTWDDLPPDIDCAETHPQWPKRRFLPQQLLGGAFRVPRSLPLRVFGIGGLELVGLPGEPTTMVVHRIRQALVEQGATGAVVCGYTGSYAGYFTTPEEYEHQDYEGASTLWGRWTGDWLAEQVGACAAGQTTPVDTDELSESFAPLSVTSRMKLVEPAVGPSLRIKRKGKRGWQLQGSWSSPTSTLHNLAGSATSLEPSPMLRLELRNADGSWQALQLEGQDVDDCTRGIRVRLWLSRGLFDFRWVLPYDERLEGRRLRFRVTDPRYRPSTAVSRGKKLA